jgi:MscS family membrane protein
MDISAFYNNLPPDIRENLLRLLLAVLVLAFVWIARKVLARIVVAPLRQLAGRSSTRWDDVLLDAMIVPARFLIIALGLLVGAEILKVDIDTSLFVQHLIRTLVVIALFLTGYRLVNILAPSSVRLFGMTGMTVDERLLPFLRTVIKLILFAIALVIIVQEWGYDVSGLVAGLGLGGLAFSLAAQDTVKNLFGFTNIVGDRPFVVGDFIKTPDVEGTVEHVGVRSTRIRQQDQAYVSVPNSTLANSAILNWSRLSKRWINMTLRITYDADLDHIEKLLERLREMLKSRDSVDDDSVLVRFINFGDAGMEILIRCYIALADWGAFTEEREIINLEILKIIEELGLHIAFPARPLYVGTTPPSPPKADIKTNLTEEKKQ